MKMLFVVGALSLICLGGTVTSASAQFLDQDFTSTPAPGPNSEVTQEIRNVEALKQLKGKSDSVAVYAQGLCCPSCSIGVRKKVSALDFVDTEKPKSGVMIDAKNQLVVIAIKPGSNIDMKALSKAVDDAGYPAVHLYSIKNEQLVTKPFLAN